MTPEELRARTKKFATRLRGYAAPAWQAVTYAASAACRAEARSAEAGADESLYGFQVLIESKLADGVVTQKHRREAEELTKIMAASLRTAKRNRARAKEREARNRKGPQAP